MWTDCDHAHTDEEEAVFRENNLSDYKITQCKTEDDVIVNCKDAVVLLNQYTPLREKVFSSLPNLKCVVRYGVGVDNVDLEAASRHHVAVCNVPDYGTLEVADQALTLMLASIRKVVATDTQVKNLGWDFSAFAPIHRISTLKVGIIGLGRIGKAFAKRVHALDCEVLGYDVINTIENDPNFDFVKFTDLDTLLKTCDVISLHCGLNEQNVHFMNEAAFLKMKEGAILINVSRGGLINEQDLANALISGQLSAAGIDVTCKEPLPEDNPLRKAPNITFSPHIAWYSVESASDLKTKAAQEAARAVLGQKLRCPVNKF